MNTPTPRVLRMAASAVRSSMSPFPHREHIARWLESVAESQTHLAAANTMLGEVAEAIEARFAKGKRGKRRD